MIKKLKDRVIKLDCCLNEVVKKLPVMMTGRNLEITPNGLLQMGEGQTTGDGEKIIHMVLSKNMEEISLYNIKIKTRKLNGECIENSRIMVTHGWMEETLKVIILLKINHHIKALFLNHINI